MLVSVKYPAPSIGMIPSPVLAILHHHTGNKSSKMVNHTMYHIHFIRTWKYAKQLLVECSVRISRFQTWTSERRATSYCRRRQSYSLPVPPYTQPSYAASCHSIPPGCTPRVAAWVAPVLHHPTSARSRRMRTWKRGAGVRPPSYAPWCPRGWHRRRAWCPAGGALVSPLAHCHTFPASQQVLSL